MVEVACLDQVEAAERFLRLRERPVGDNVAANRRGGARRLERVAAEYLAAPLADLPGEPAVRLHRLLERLLPALGVAALSLVDQDRVLGHGQPPSSCIRSPLLPTNGRAWIRQESVPSFATNPALDCACDAGSGRALSQQIRRT